MGQSTTDAWRAQRWWRLPDALNPAAAQVQTEVMGDIHHYAWRAQHRNQTAYIAPRDGERFGSWTKEQCAIEDCLEVICGSPPKGIP